MTTTSASLARKGGCFCGAVRYEVTAAPSMSGFCYCESCRRLSGSGHTFHALVPEEALKVSGTVKDFQWIADSGNTVTTSFCPTCGSPLFGKSPGMPGQVTFRVASLDNPESISPHVAVYTKRLLPWDHLKPDIAAFEEMPPMPKAS